LALREIGEGAFRWSGLKRIVIPISMGLIGPLTFEKCRSLASVAFEGGPVLREIGEAAFMGSELKRTVIPVSVGVIDPWAFEKCRSLESVTVEGDSVVRAVASSAFVVCRCFGGLEFPGSLAAARRK
jgi:hypothetical protein